MRKRYALKLTGNCEAVKSLTSRLVASTPAKTLIHLLVADKEGSRKPATLDARSSVLDHFLKVTGNLSNTTQRINPRKVRGGPVRFKEVVKPVEESKVQIAPRSRSKDGCDRCPKTIHVSGVSDNR